MTRTSQETLDEAATKYNANVSALVAWLDENKGNVDHFAFREECDRIAHEVIVSTLSERAAVVATGHGVLTLDYVACRLGLDIPGELIHSRMPGASQYREL